MEAANSTAQNPICVCCFEVIGEYRARPRKCFHFCHPDCLRKWAILLDDENDDMTCPSCRIPFTAIVVMINERTRQKFSIEYDTAMRRQLQNVCYKCVVRDDGPLVKCGRCNLNFHDTCPLMEKKNLEVSERVGLPICQTCKEILAKGPDLRQRLAMLLNSADNAESDLDFEDEPELDFSR